MDLDKFKKRDNLNFMRFNKSKCKVLRKGQDKSQYQYILGNEGVESSPAE